MEFFIQWNCKWSSATLLNKRTRWQIFSWSRLLESNLNKEDYWIPWFSFVYSTKILQSWKKGELDLSKLQENIHAEVWFNKVALKLYWNHWRGCSPVNLLHIFRTHFRAGSKDFEKGWRSISVTMAGRRRKS